MFNCQLDLLLEEIIHFGTEAAAFGKETNVFLNPQHAFLKSPQCPLHKGEREVLHPCEEVNFISQGVM